MAEAIVSTILEQLALILVEQTAAGVRLIAGAEEEVENLHRRFHLIKAVVEDAEKRQMKENSVRVWLDDLKHASYDMEDVLDEWNTAIRKLQMKRSSGDANVSQPMRTVRPSFIIPSYWFSPGQLVQRHNIATKIKNVDKKLDNIVRDINAYGFIISREQGSGKVASRPSTTSFLDESYEIRGRNHLQNKVASLLMSGSESSTASAASSSQVPTQRPTIISITGMGGIGKTTLAKLIFNDNEVRNHFNEKIWVCVSEPFDDIRIAKAILESLKGSATNAVESETVLKQLRESIEGKKFFLVLDDVWTEEPQNWEQLLGCLRCGSKESRILVTTRNEKVAIAIGTTKFNIIPIELLSDEDCWSIFSQLALSRRLDIEESENFENIGRQIVSKCKGLPLAVKTLGSLLRFKGKIEEWQRVLENELWELEELDEGLLGPLLLSYLDLPPPLKKCFSYCAIFPKDSRLEKDKLIRLWMAQDYLKVKGREDMVVGEGYFENLAMRSLFQDFERSEHDGGKIISCQMHDMVHDFSQFLTKTECSALDVNKSRLQLPCWKARHLMITGETRSEMVPFPSMVYDETKLRSLVLDQRLSFKPRIALSKLFDRLTCLRSIDGLPVGQIPKGIKKLIHLRYLALGENPWIKELPEALCELCNLQTLDVSLCHYLKRLPERIGQLINLRHLMNSKEEWSRLSYMPRGMERLTGLRTLGAFVASGGKSSKACSSLKSLNKLKHLEGSLTLRGLGNERDLGDDNDDEKVDLKSKMKLVDLHLRFDSTTKTKDHRVVLECLQPPSSLEKLGIYGYAGDTISPTSDWMLSLAKLRVLTLRFCNKCECLPPLGKLPCLETLVLEGMSSIKRLDNEFLGIAEDHQARADQAETASSIIRDTAFPRLETLEFLDMEKWEEWDDCEIAGGKTIMPRLRHLSICWSPELKALPDYILGSTSLDKLLIYYSRHLNNRYNNETGPDWPKISHVPNISFTLHGPAAQGSL
ncbi:hypothetical protein KPL71_020301 [Citrus sinensis]|uniref:Uncharacterized protein n=1 Tax=Citrus sinensis TaxID=2711 RepID=A0ACB8J6X2_CITSI|nr:hypothetical protein KPL71_020301 [Citrus sinensis]